MREWHAERGVECTRARGLIAMREQWHTELGVECTRAAGLYAMRE